MFRAIALLGSLAVTALAQTGSLDFRVVSNGGTPVPAASVTIEGPDGRSYSGTTGRDGHWRIADLAPGVYRFTAFNAAGYVSAPHNFLADISIHEKHTRDFLFELRPTPTIQGTLFDETGNPIAGATVVARTPGFYSMTGTASTAANGFYSLRLIAPPDSFLFSSKLPALSVPPPNFATDLRVSRPSSRSGGPLTVEFELPVLSGTTVNLHLTTETAAVR